MSRCACLILFRYGATLLALGAATMAWFLWQWLLEGQAPLAFYGAAVVSAAWYGGRGPCLAAIGGASVLAVWTSVLPQQGAQHSVAGDVVSLLLLCSAGLVIAGLMESRRSSERLLPRLLDSLFVFVGVCTRDGILVEANQMAWSHLTPGRLDVLGRPLAEIYWWSYCPQVQQRLRQAIARAQHGISSRYDVDIRLAEDHYLTLDFQLAPLFDERGRVTHLVSSAIDITDRKGAEEALLEANRWLTSTVRSITDAFLSIDGNWIVTSVNPAAEEILRATAEELVGHNIWQQFPAAVPTAVHRELHRALQENQASHFEEYYAPLDVWIEVHAYPSEFGLAVYFRNINERKCAELALRESEEYHRQFVNSLPQLVWTCRSDGYCDFLSQQWVEYTGVPMEAQLGDGWSHALHPEDRPRVFEAWRAAVEERDAYDLEFRIRRHDGEYRWFKTRGRAVRDSRGRIRRWFGSCTDIHDQKHLEQALKEDDSRKDQFLATLAHELRNPLAPIRNSLQLIKLHADSPARVQQARQIADRQLQHMIRLVDDLLDLSRITRGKVQLDRQRVDLAQAIHSALETSQPQIEQAKHQLIVSLPPEPIDLEIDKVRIAQAVSNLLVNAAKYTAPGGRIELSVRRERRQAVIAVADDGMGIPPDMLSKVFQMFIQVDHRLDKAHGGLGIGLTLVKSLVEMHGGCVEAHSAGPGFGSTFTIRLPLPRHEASDHRAETKRVVAKGSAVASRRILVVDDNVDSARTEAMLLEASGHEVHVANNGPDALRLACHVRPEVVVLDIGMPGMDGCEVARRLRRDPSLDGLTIIALTGWGQEADRQRSREAGCDHHLVKPVDSETLERLLQQ